MSSKFERKHVLLDTCFLIKASQYSTPLYFDKLFDFFQQHDCVPIVNDFIEFEFLRGCQKVDHLKNKRAFIQALSQASLNVTPDIIKNAIIISNIYANKRIHSTQISMIDCCISSFLMKYSANVILATLDNNDYPLIIHDRLHIETIDTGKEILNIGLYSLNQSNFNKARRNLY